MHVRFGLQPGGLVRDHGLGVLGKELARGPGAVLGLVHGAELAQQEDGRQDEDQNEDVVETVGNGFHKDAVGVGLDTDVLESVADQADLVGHPGGDQGDARDGRGRGVDDEGQLFAGNAHLVRHGPHDRPDRQGVGVVVEENQQAQHPGHELGAARGPGAPGQRLGNGLGSAHARNQRDEPADGQALEHDARVPRVGQGGEDFTRQAQEALHKAVVEIESPGFEHEGAGKHADEQRKNHVLGQKGQGNGHQGRNQGPESENLGIGRAERGIPGQGRDAGGKQQQSREQEPRHKGTHERPLNEKC